MAKFKIGNACKKCGERGASVRYDTIPGLEVMHRVCKLCGYSWVEEPLNTQTSEKNLADSSQAVQQTQPAIPALDEKCSSCDRSFEFGENYCCICGTKRELSDGA